MRLATNRRLERSSLFESNMSSGRPREHVAASKLDALSSQPPSYARFLTCANVVKDANGNLKNCTKPAYSECDTCHLIKVCIFSDASMEISGTAVSLLTDFSFSIAPRSVRKSIGLATREIATTSSSKRIGCQPGTERNALRRWTSPCVIRRLDIESGYGVTCRRTMCSSLKEMKVEGMTRI